MLSYEEVELSELETAADLLVANLKSQKVRVEQAAKTWGSGKKAKMEVSIIELFEIYEHEFVSLKKNIDDDEGYFDDPEDIERFEKVKENWNYAVKLYEEVVKLANEKLGGYGSPKQYKEF